MNIPSSKLREIAEVNPRLSERPEPETAVSFLGMADVDAESGTTNRGDERKFRDVSKGYTQFADGDLLVAKITPCFENGKIAQARLSHARGAGSTEFHVIRPNLAKVDARFLLNFLRHPAVRAMGEMRMTGSAGQRRVPESYLAELDIPLPALEKQRRIAQALDHVDSLRTKRRQALSLLDDLAQSVFLDMFGDPASNPKGWPMKKIGDLVDSASYGTSEKASGEGDLPVLRMGNITSSGQIDLGDLKFMDRASTDEKYLIRSGDILFNRTNSADLVGKTAIYRGNEALAFAGYLVRVRMNKSNDPEYLAAFLNTQYAKRVLRGMCKSIVGMANINARELQGIDIAEPPRNLQEDFAKRIGGIESLRDIHRRHLVELDALFASLQERAFRGEMSSDNPEPSI